VKVGVFEPSDLLSSSAHLGEIEGIRLIISSVGAHQWTSARTFLWGDACVGSDVSLSFYSSDMRVMEGDNKTVAGKAFLSRKVSCKACKLHTYPHTYKFPQTKTNKHFRFEVHILFFVHIEIKNLLIFVCISVAGRVNLIFKNARHKQFSEQKKRYFAL